MDFTLSALFRGVVVGLVGLTFIACGAKKVEKVNIVIPQPPEEPRLFYIDRYHGSSSFTDSGTLDLLIGEDKGATSGNLFKPYGVAGTNGMMYVSDTAVGNVFAFDLKNKRVTHIGDRVEGKLNTPAGVTLDSKNNVYVSDTKQKKVYGYSPDGSLIFALGKKGEFIRPAGLAIDKKLNRIYVVDVKAHQVKVYSLNGKRLFQFGKRGMGDGEFNFPTNVAISPINGNIVIVDTQNFRVQIFDKDGKFIRKFGQIGDQPGTFARPKGVAIDSEGHIYVADAAFNLVQVFNEAGNLLLYFGGHGRSPGLFWQMAGMYIDSSDKVYIVDNMGNAVQVYQYVSKKWKKANPKKYKELKTLKNNKVKKSGPMKKKKLNPSDSDILEQTPGKGELEKDLHNF